MRWSFFSLASSFLLVIGTPLSGVSGAHPADDPKCLTQVAYGSDPQCKAHWHDYHMNYHWVGQLAAEHHKGERDSWRRARDTWRDACCPDSPWHTHFVADSKTHVDMLDWFGATLGMGQIAKQDGSFHIPQMHGLWLRHDIWERTCNEQPCAWYVGTGTPPRNEIDAWSVWEEELGHAQNMNHTSQTNCGYTMSGCTNAGTIGKRTLTDHLKWHACDPYRRLHNAC